MASGRIVVEGFMPALDLNGSPIPGAKLTFYLNKTSSLQAVYTDPELTVPHTNPVVADAGGQFPSIFANPNVTYTVDLADADGAPVGFASRDDVRSIGRPGTPSDEQVATVVGTLVIPRVASIASLRAASWPDGRPARVSLDILTVDGDGGGIFRWVSASTATDDGILIVKETATATGRWFREAASVQGNRTLTLEALGAVGNGVTDDTDAFESAAELLPLGWTVMGLGNYVISSTITIDADQNEPWEDRTSPRQGKLTINGSVKATHNGIAFDLYGNQGGASGPNLEILCLIGPGYASTSSKGVRMESGEHTLVIGEIAGFHTGILMNGCWSSTITYSSLFDCRYGVKGQLGTNNASTNNDIYIYADHTGGAFTNVDLPERRPVSVDVGFDLDHMTGCHFLLGDVQYCQIETTSTGIVLGANTESNTLRAYIEGNVPYPETGRLLQNLGRNNDCRLSATNSPDNVVSAIQVKGLGNKIRGIGQRTGGDPLVAPVGAAPPSPVYSMSPDRSAGAISVRPGNEWIAASNVHDHENLYAENYNISGQALSAYALGNCTYAALTTGLPDVNNVQAGATFTTANASGSAAISPTFTIASAAYDRPIYVRTWVRLVTGPATVALYLQESGSNVAIQKAWISQGLDTVGQWQRIDLAAIIPSGQTTFKLRLAMRTVDDAQTGGCVVDWAFPLISWQEKPWSFVNLVPPSPNILPGNTVMESLRPAQQNATVDGAGNLDCNYAPLVRITSAAANIGVLANLSPGLTTILNDTASAIDINTSTGLAAIKTITARRHVTLYKVGSSLYADV